MTSTLSNDDLARLLEGTTVSLGPGDIKKHQSALTSLGAKATGIKVLDLVAVACRMDNPPAHEWATGVIRAKQPEVPETDNAEIVQRLAAAAVMKHLGAKGIQHVAMALAVRNAEFLGHAPALADLTGAADAALAAEAGAARARPDAPTTIAERISAVLSADPGHDDAGNPKLPDFAGAIMELTKAFDEAMSDLHERLELVDEEYDALWWSYSNRSVGADETWEKVDPPCVRAVLIADELGRRVQRVPAPPIVDGLVVRAIGSAAENSVDLAALGLAAVEHNVRVAEHTHQLLPLSTIVAKVRELGADDDTWRTVVERSTKIDVESKAKAVDAARQLIREVEIGCLLR